MAIVIPDSISSKASQGEKTLYGVLRDNLPDDYWVWYEPRVESLYPDFIVLSPSLGLLIIEVKGWYAGNVISANNDFFQITYRRGEQERVETQQSPLRQCRGYFTAALDTFKQYSILTNPDGNYRGKLVFPTGYGAVMSNINAAQAQAESIYSLLPQPQVAYRDELLEWTEYRDRALINRLKEMFTVRFPFPALTDDQLETIRGILHPEMKIKEVPATPASVPAGVELQPDSSVIKSLDFQQEQLARNIRDGHRLFFGVAGSGKTLILLSRAKHLIQTNPEYQILVLCFNITLAAYLRSLLHDDATGNYKAIEVLHFHAWAKEILGRLPNPQSVRGDYDELLGEQLLSAIAVLPEAERWDSILMDEAHTFSPNWFRCCTAALKDPESGDLMIVSDGSQSLYERRKFRWSSVGIKARGRSKKLDKNYRNTQEILSAAWSLLHSVPEETDPDVTFPVVKPEMALRNGTVPVLQVASSLGQEVDLAVETIQSLMKEGYEPKDIAILYRHKSRSDPALFNQLIGKLNQTGLGAYWVTQNDEAKANYRTQTPGVRILTGLSALGLEFKVVIVLWVQKYANACASDGELAARERRQLYVAMTRAQEKLYLFGSVQTPLLKELRQSQQFQVVGVS